MVRTRAQTSGFPRVSCLVAGCRRGTTRIKPLEEGQSWVDQADREPHWICGEHWRRIPLTLKRRRKRLLRAWRRNVDRGTDDPREIERRFRLERLLTLMWTRCEQHARGERIVVYSSERLPSHLVAELQREGLL